MPNPLPGAFRQSLPGFRRPRHPKSIAPKTVRLGHVADRKRLIHRGYNLSAGQFIETEAEAV